MFTLFIWTFVLQRAWESVSGCWTGGSLRTRSCSPPPPSPSSSPAPPRYSPYSRGSTSGQATPLTSTTDELGENHGCRFGSIGSGFNWVSVSGFVFGTGSGFRRTKMTHKNRKKLRNFMYWSAGSLCSLLRAEGFFCNMDVLYEGLRIGKL